MLEPMDVEPDKCGKRLMRSLKSFWAMVIVGWAVSKRLPANRHCTQWLGFYIIMYP